MKKEGGGSAKYFMRQQKAMGKNDVLAKRVAGRAIENKVSSSHPDFQYDATLYEKLKNEANWYLPLPGEVVEPVDPENVPTGKLSE